jgi:hypothetical protein
MENPHKLHVISAIVFIVFAVLAGGSLDDSPTDSKSTTPSTGSAPASPSLKQTVLDGALLDFTWSTDGMVMTANFKVHNTTEHAFKDFEITCEHSAPSGTVIDHNTRTVYEIVPPKSTKSIRNFNMGFINSQAKSSSCHITDLVVID